MMQLPDSLKPWREWLAWFDPELAPMMGELLRRLEPLLGRFRGRASGGEPEPDGLDDLKRRGSYERLLSSEWLLADEIPDEFLRRAVSGEHLFLSPKPRAKRADRLIVALFDAGPAQLGAPRLAHIAVWILLARRARAAGAELRWGVLQDEPELHSADKPEALRQLLRARSYLPVAAEQAARWRDWLAAQSEPAGECWVVGTGPVEPALKKRCSHRIAIEENLNGTALQLEIGEPARR